MSKKINALKVAYLRVLVFACAAFVVNTTEFIPVALLSDIGQSFGLPVSQVGLMITVYAWVVTLMSLPFMLLTANIERKKLLMGVFAVFIAGHVLSVCAWNFEILLLSRTVIALSHALFWALTATLVMRVAPKGKRQQALGWRTTFGLIALMAFGLMVLMYRLLPTLESRNSGSLKSVPVLLKRPLLLGLYFLTMTAVTAHFAVYSYIEPFVLHIAHMSGGAATMLLLVFGVSGMAASWLFGRFHPKYPQPFLMTALAFLTASLLLLLPISGNQTALFGLVFVWGVAIACLGLAMNMRVLQLAPDATDVATSMFSAIFNIGIGGGALLGGLVMRHSENGLAHIGWVGAALAAFAALVFAAVYQKFRHTAPAKP